MDRAVFVTAAGVVIGMGVWYVAVKYVPVAVSYVVTFMGG